MSETPVFVTDGHLGGYIVGGDPQTLEPDMWEHVIRTQDIKSVLDVGCGDGAALQWFSERVETVLGIDGIAQPEQEERIWEWDYTKGPAPFFDGVEAGFDLVWSAEFVEHVAEEHVGNFIDTFKRGRIVLMTHALPGQGGYHHVNERDGGYWIDQMMMRGFAYDPELTGETRRLAQDNGYYRRSGLAFRNEEGI